MQGLNYFLKLCQEMFFHLCYLKLLELEHIKLLKETPKSSNQTNKALSLLDNIFKAVLLHKFCSLLDLLFFISLKFQMKPRQCGSYRSAFIRNKTLFLLVFSPFFPPNPRISESSRLFPPPLYPGTFTHHTYLNPPHIALCWISPPAG